MTLGLAYPHTGNISGDDGDALLFNLLPFIFIAFSCREEFMMSLRLELPRIVLTNFFQVCNEITDYRVILFTTFDTYLIRGTESLRS